MQDELKATLRCANQAFEAGMRAGQQGATPKWRPIETAPKDGTEIDLWHEGDRIADAYWKGGRWWAPNFDYDGCDGVIGGPPPTHWMPLPAPPEEPK